MTSTFLVNLETKKRSPYENISDEIFFLSAFAAFCHLLFKDTGLYIFSKSNHGIRRCAVDIDSSSLFPGMIDQVSSFLLMPPGNTVPETEAVAPLHYPAGGDFHSKFLFSFSNDVLDDESVTEKIHADSYGMLLKVDVRNEVVALRFFCASPEIPLEQTGNAFANFINEIRSFPAKRMDELEFLSPGEKSTLLEQLNNTCVPAYKSAIFSQLFEQIVQTNPLLAAIASETGSITYEELNTRTCRLANYLHQHGATTGTIVAIGLDRSPDLLIGLLSIMRTGATFVPIDPSFPAERIKYVLRDSGASILLHGPSLSEKIDVTGEIKLINLIDVQEFVNECPDVLPNITFTSKSPVYIIYTSGSTGLPKGVIIRHESLANVLLSVCQVINMQQGDRMLSVTSVSFDIAYLELLMPLICGGTVILPGHETVIDPFLLSGVIENTKPAFMQATPATWQMLADSGWQNKEGIGMLSGGEAISENLVNLLLAGSGNAKTKKLWNFYGPTETTIWSTVKQLHTSEKVSIGQPLANTEVYVVDRHMKLLPKGFAGELVIGGIGVADGYLNREQLTKEKFPANIFSGSSETMYRTGDFVRLLPDNNIEFIGRQDEQVKIRGHRIELGEIEAVMQSLEEIAKCCCIVLPDAGLAEKKVTAYYLADEAYLKAFTRLHYAEQVNAWQDVYDSYYSKTNDHAAVDKIDTTIWNDSFTGKKIPRQHIQEWLADIIAVIQSGPHEKVMEIGCGTGLIYFNMGNGVKYYTGTDLSKACVEQIKEVVRLSPDTYPQTEVYACAAHEVQTANDNIDVVVINSVIQYFPDEIYLAELIGKAIASLRGKGRIVIGDVKDIRLLEAFKSRLTLSHIPDESSIKDYHWNVTQALLKEEQLSVSPQFFCNLKEKYPEIAAVEILLKKCTHINEMTLYRYNVVIHTGNPSIVRPNWKAWDYVKENDPAILFEEELFAVKDIPNAKLFTEKQIKEMLSFGKASNVGDLKAKLKANDHEFEMAASLIEQAQNSGFSYRIFVNNDPFKVNIVFEKTGKQSLVENYWSPISDLKMTNVPYNMQAHLELHKIIKNKLLLKLPGFMVPETFIPVHVFPVTYNKKTDKKFLAEQKAPSVETAATDTPSSSNPVSAKLQEIWKAVLQVNHIRESDSFFEIGGHSLTATRIVASIRKVFKKTMLVSDIFANPTIQAMVAYLDSLPEEKDTFLAEDESNNSTGPLSFFQEAVLKKEAAAVIKLHIPFRIDIQGDLNKPALEYAFKKIIKRHEILRSVVAEENEVRYQQVLQADRWQVSSIHAAQCGGSTADYIRKFVETPFDVYKEYPIKVLLIELSKKEWVLILVLHPLVGDGWSMSVLFHELTMLYDAAANNLRDELPLLKSQYRHFAGEQRNYIAGKLFQQKIAFWKQMFSNVHTLELPFDFCETMQQERKGQWIRFTVPEETWHQVWLLAKAQNATPFMLMLTIYALVLSRFSTGASVCICTPIANRLRPEDDLLIGYFANMLPLCLHINKNISFLQSVNLVKSQLLEIYNNQEVPMGFMEEIVLEYGTTTPAKLFPVTFEFNNMPVIPISLDIKNLKTTISEIAQPGMEKDIRLSLTVIDGTCYGGLKYCTNLFKEATVETFVEDYLNYLALFLESPDTEIAELLKIKQTAEPVYNL